MGVALLGSLGENFPIWPRPTLVVQSYWRWQPTLGAPDGYCKLIGYGAKRFGVEQRGATMSLKRIYVSLFVDWQAQLINSGAINIPAKRQAASALKFVADRTTTVLEAYDDRAIFAIVPKLYHGWHRGLTPTDSLKALNEAFNDRNAPTRLGRSTFDWSSPFGSILSNCSPHRLHKTLRIHLPNTLRANLDGTGELREKMVDTALTCDVLASARSDPSHIRLIMGEDDDLVPAAFTADAWSKEKGGKTLIVRCREQSEFIEMNGIYKKMLAHAA